ncbi:MAG: histidine phosphatase family protein [Xanthomonadales bacterium]|nr:histidine phosphatase family protein [Xanthomonadales bacterium]
MQQLYLLRHAKAEPWSPLGNDFSRPLSDKGKRHAQALSSWAVDTLDPPDTVLCSPAKRTRETLAPLLAKWPQLLSATDYVDSIYGASTDMLLTLAVDAFSYSQRVLMVGHNPGFEYLLLKLLQVDHAAEVKKMATGTLAVIGFPAGFKGVPGNGCLQHLTKGKDLAA